VSALTWMTTVSDVQLQDGVSKYQYTRHTKKKAEGFVLTKDLILLIIKVSPTNSRCFNL
jgi:hypothetical protein